MNESTASPITRHARHGGGPSGASLAQQERRDALGAFARIATALHGEIGTIDADIKFTIGRLSVQPNAPSVVPSRVSFSIDLRHPDNSVLDAAGVRIVDQDAGVAADSGPALGP